MPSNAARQWRKLIISLQPKLSPRLWQTFPLAPARCSRSARAVQVRPAFGAPLPLPRWNSLFGAATRSGCRSAGLRPFGPRVPLRPHSRFGIVPACMPQWQASQSVNASAAREGTAPRPPRGSRARAASSRSVTPTCARGPRRPARRPTRAGCSPRAARCPSFRRGDTASACGSRRPACRAGGRGSRRRPPRAPHEIAECDARAR